MITQQRENWNPWTGTGISFLWWRDFFFFFIVTTNQSTASFQNDTILQKLCKLRWFRLSSWFSTFIRSQPRVDIKHWAQTVKMSLHNVKLRLLVTVGDRDSLASGRLSHPDGKVICSHLFIFFKFSSGHSEILPIPLGVQVQSGSRERIKSALSTWLHMCAGVCVQVGRRVS